MKARPAGFLRARSSNFWPRSIRNYMQLRIKMQRGSQGNAGPGGAAPQDYLIALPLLPLNLGQQQFFPARGAVDVSGERR